MFDYEKLRDVIRRGIGDGTQAGFAHKCGITPQHLNKLMNADHPARPSKTTLEKIASCTETSYDELLVICGYVESRSTLRRKRPAEQRADLNAKEMEEGFKSMTRGSRPYHSIRDFLEEYAMLYSTEDITFRTGPMLECEDDRAEFLAPCTITFKDKDYECTTWFVVYYYKTVGGKYFISETAMDAKSIEEAGINCGDRSDAQYVYLIKYRKSDEERLLESIFGDLGDTYQITVVGFGFDFDKEPEQFDTFLKAHRKSLPEDLDINSILKSSEYEHGSGVLAAKIMREETGLPFCYYENEREEKHGCVMVPEGQYELEDIKPITRKYARELGIPKYGECIAYTTAMRDNKMIFDTEDDI